jgi:hypothetical protein
MDGPVGTWGAMSAITALQPSSVLATVANVVSLLYTKFVNFLSETVNVFTFTGLINLL